ncbi:hypothetical protein [Mucilaginibacter sp. HD30]
MLQAKNYHVKRLPFCLPLLFLLSIHVSFGQSISGSVNDSLTPLSGAIVKNISIQKLTLTDVKGNFKINGSKGDTLVTVFFNCKTDTTIVSGQTLFAITLQPLSRVLSEATINGHRLSPLAQFRKNQENYKQIYRIGDNSHLFSFNGDYRHMGVGLSLDALYSNFSKEGKNARRLQQVFVSRYNDDIIDNRFTKDLVGRITGYQGKQLENFMADNRPSFDFIQSATDYDLIQFIQRRVRGVILPTDNPAIRKKEGSGFKIVFKNPDIKPKTVPGIR